MVPLRPYSKDILQPPRERHQLGVEHHVRHASIVTDPEKREYCFRLWERLIAVGLEVDVR